MWHSWLWFFHGHGFVEGDELPHTYYMEGDGVAFLRRFGEQATYG